MNREPRIDLHTVRVVRAIAELGSVTAAAAALGYSQPALSQHLRRAEARIGAPLVLRAGRGVRLTEPGRILARHSVTVLAALDDAEEELARLVDLAAGVVRIAGFPSASSTIVPPVIAKLTAEYPALQVAYTEAEPPEALRLLADGEVDLAITFSYPGDPADPHNDHAGTAVIDLFDDPVAIALPKKHRLAGQEPVALGEVRNERWIAGCPLCRGHLLAACAAIGFTPQIAHATDNVVAVLGLVAAGVGVALLPRLALTPLEVPDRVAVRSVSQVGDRGVRVVHVRGAEQVPTVRASISGLVETARELDKAL